MTPPTRTRLPGVDLARGLAVLGMFVAHLGDEGPDGGPDPAWFAVFDGRSAALFAFLAGVSIGLMSGGGRQPDPATVRRTRVVVAVRAAVLFPLGLALVLLQTPVLVILPAYAAMFLLMLPVVGWRPVPLVTAASVVVVVVPTLVALATTPLGGAEQSLLGRLTGLDEPPEIPGDVLATGPYPALLWVAYLMVGLAVARWDLANARTQRALVFVGLGLTILTWRVARFGEAAVGPDPSALEVRLLRADPHDYSTPEVLGNLGTALGVLGACLLVTTLGNAAGRAVTALTAPVRAVGAMSLSVYSIHIVAIAVLGNDVVWYPESNAVLVWFIVAALAGAWAWRATLGQGPLERAMRGVSEATAGPKEAAVDERRLHG